MATSVIMPALEMAQESGVLVNWLKHEGEPVNKGEPLMEIETDKVTVEIEAPDSGILGGVLAREGDVVPVGRTIAWILAPGETPPAAAPTSAPMARSAASSVPRAVTVSQPALAEVSPLARKIAQEHGIDLSQVRSGGKRIEKADVLAYIEGRAAAQKTSPTWAAVSGLIPASPKARRLAAERGIALETIRGSGPEGAVLADDIPTVVQPASVAQSVETESMSTVWRVMAERMSASWTSVPHFYLIREVEASGLIEWKKQIAPAVEKRTGIKPTYTDLLVKMLGFTLKDHPRLNSAWAAGEILRNREVNVGIATAIDDGLIVPVIHGADAASLGEIVAQRHDLIGRAQSHKLRPADIADGTFTLSNLGMYNVDAFNAIVNTPQAAILAVGRIAERVVPVDGQVVIRPMLVLTLSCDHRVVDGARAAQFLDDLAVLIENPWGLLQ